MTQPLLHYHKSIEPHPNSVRLYKQSVLINNRIVSVFDRHVEYFPGKELTKPESECHVRGCGFFASGTPREALQTLFPPTSDNDGQLSRVLLSVNCKGFKWTESFYGDSGELKHSTQSYSAIIPVKVCGWAADIPCVGNKVDRIALFYENPDDTQPKFLRYQTEKGWSQATEADKDLLRKRYPTIYDLGFVTSRHNEEYQEFLRDLHKINSDNSNSGTVNRCLSIADKITRLFAMGFLTFENQ